MLKVRTILRAIVFLEHLFHSQPMPSLYLLHQQSRSLKQYKLLLSVFFLPHLWNFAEILEQEFYSISTSWDIHDSAMADGCNIYNLFSNLVILQPMSMVMKRKYYY